MMPSATARTMAAAITLLCTGCATAPERATRDTALAEFVSWAAETTQAYERGRADVYDELRNDPAFRVTDYQLSECRDRVSWLPRKGAIDDVAFWKARQRNMWLLKQCRKRNDAKIPVIFRMIDRVRRGD